MRKTNLEIHSSHDSGDIKQEYIGDNSILIRSLNGGKTYNLFHIKEHIHDAILEGIEGVVFLGIDYRKTMTATGELDEFPFYDQAVRKLESVLLVSNEVPQ